MTHYRATDTTLDALIATAGTDYRWTGFAGTQSEPQGAALAGLAQILREAQGGDCVACGEALAGEAVNVCHLVSGSRARRGYCAIGGVFNLYLGHRTCNETDSETFGDVVPLESLALPHLILSERPTRGDMLAAAERIAGSRKADRAAARLARMGR